jgi:hypothetical protein
LFHKDNPAAMPVGGATIGFRGARANDNADFFRAGVDRFLDRELQGRFVDSVTIDEMLQGQSVLRGAGGSDHCLPNPHIRDSACQYGWAQHEPGTRAARSRLARVATISPPTPRKKL